MEAPQITSHPECISQCNGRASASGHNPGTWNISYHEDKPGQCEKRSLFSELITCSATGILITQSQAIQRPRGERFQCGPKDFPELQTGGPRSLVQMEVDNQSHRSSTCLSLSEACQPLSPSSGCHPNPRGRCWPSPHSLQAPVVEAVFQLPLHLRPQPLP